MLGLLLSAFVSMAASCAAVPLQTRIAGIARGSGGTVGAAVMIAETGEMLTAFNPDRHFPMQSVYKLPIGMAVLDQVDHGVLSLDQPVRVDKTDFISPGQYSPIRDRHPDGVTLPLRELLRLAVSESDGTASDVVMRLAGGPSRIDAYLHALGIDTIKVIDTEMKIGRDERVQYRNWATPAGAVALLRALQTGRTLTPASRALLQQFLTDTPRASTRLKGLLPPETIVAHKPGTSGLTRAGLAAATNDIGLITLPDGRHLAIAVFLTDSRAPDTARDATIAQIARAAWDCVSTSASSR